MKAKNAPFDMDSDDVAMLAMARLCGSGRLNDKNVDCFIQGYEACMEALYIPYRLIPILRYHHKELSGVKQHILDAIDYADLRRGINEEERARINSAEKIANAIEPLIEVLEEEKK